MEGRNKGSLPGRKKGKTGYCLKIMKLVWSFSNTVTKKSHRGILIAGSDGVNQTWENQAEVTGAVPSGNLNGCWGR